MTCARFRHLQGQYRLQRARTPLAPNASLTWGRAANLAWQSLSPLPYAFTWFGFNVNASEGDRACRC